VAAMNLSLSHCFVTVHDQEEALAFYRDVLGLEVRIDAPFEDFRWLTVGPPSQPDVEIVLEAPGMGRPPAARKALEELMAQGALSGVLFRTDDVDATFEKVRAAGAEVMQEPIDMPYGVRDCAFRDPSGNQIRIANQRKE
jgi:catechol 2,3-dioxygenase-like lactoylglutathione lyase family enzyme